MDTYAAHDLRRIIAMPRAVSLSDFDPADTNGMEKAGAKDELKALQDRIQRQQELLWGAAHNAVLVILQGLDTAGKDGSIKHVLARVNPVGCQVTNFKAPTPEDLAHDFLWRVHKHTPPLSALGVFNRSHYEDVLAVRVHELVAQDVWERRYAQINDFERMLTQSGVIIFKFFLHISKDEQKKRLLAREQDADKAWKLAVGDWEERKHWDAYQRAYEDALGRCGTEWAPWHIVPADRKWYRNIVIARTLVEGLAPYERLWTQELVERGKQAMTEIRAYHKQGAKDA
ncbi:MAG: PPK2 family polyphosphate kinase [Ktedonobacterales bacterium]